MHLLWEKPKLSPFHSNVSLLLVIFLVVQSLKSHFYPGNLSLWWGFVLLSLPACYVKIQSPLWAPQSCWHLFLQQWSGGKLCQGEFSLGFLFYLTTWRNTPHVLLNMLQSVQSVPDKSLDISGVIHPSYLMHAFPFMSPADAFNCQPLLLGFPRSSRGTMESLWRRMKRRGPAVLWHFLALNWLWEEWPFSSR